jgi:hypothetical protein
VAQGGEVLVSESTAQLTADLTEVEFSSGWSAGQRLEPGVLIKEALIEARRSAIPGGASAT